MNQASTPPTKSKAPERRPDPVSEIFSDGAMAALMKGPAGWFWRAEWVEEGLAARSDEEKEEQNNTPAPLKGWRKL